jgi:transposase
MTVPLYVGVDVGKAKNVACFMGPDGTVLLKSLNFDNSLSGAQKLVAKTKDILAQKGCDHPVFGMEATSFYHFHLMYFILQDDELKPYRPTVYQLNARNIKNFKKSYTPRGKNDTYDAFIIADNLRFGRLPKPYEVDEMYLPLQRLTRYRFHLVGSLVREKSYFLSMLFLKFSNYGDVFSDVFGATSRSLITEFYSIEEIINTPLEDMVEFLIDKGNNHFSEPEKLAKELKRIARDSYRLQPKLADSINLILETSINNIRFFEQSIRKVESVINRDMAKLSNPLESVQGIGKVYSAGIIAEIGDVTKFSSQAKLAKYAGLTWNSNQSGEFEGEDEPINKAGNRYLRYYLIEAADSLRRHNAEYQAYYQKKYREASKHAHKRAVVLTARKFVRLVYALLSKNQLYRPDKG